MSSTSLIKMANHIAANIPVRDDVVSETAEHIQRFWTPAMIDALFAAAAHDGRDLLPEVRAAVDVLLKGHSDAQGVLPTVAEQEG